MVSFKMDWSKPFQIEDSDGNLQWARYWLIPLEVRGAFFEFWKRNKYRLWAEGFTVHKLGNEWYLFEYKSEIDKFKNFSPNSSTESNTKKEIQAEEELDWIPNYKVKNTEGLRKWQVEAVSKLCSAIEKNGCAIDGSDTGVGKTYSACGVVRELNMKILVVCPKSVMESWRRVICNHFNMSDRLIEIINYEQLRIGKKDSNIASFVKNRKTHREKFTWKIPKNTLIVWDESQKLKNWKTKNSKTCIEAFKQGYKMLFCSATNATNPLELRTVGTCLRLFKGNRDYYAWCYDHGVTRGRFGLEFTNNISLRQEVLKKLHKEIFIKRGVRLTRDTIPDFPPSEIIAECYNMDEDNVKKINDATKEMELELNKLNKLIIKDKASELTAILRARQKIELIKVPLFIDMIEEGLEENMSVVVFVNFTETLQSLSKRLNINCIFDGKTPDHIRQKNVDDFQEGKSRIILVNIQSGGAGLSLHDVHGKNPRLSLISPSYSAVLMRQATGRVWRENAKSKSVQKIIFVADTVEEQVCKNVQEKLKNLDILNDGDLKYEKQYEIINN